jgi:3-hydroxybutyryl-CoA dehydrogenase
MDIKTIGVIGAGLMGNGIAQVLAQAGYTVVMRDIEDRFVENGLKTIKGNLGRLVQKEKMTQQDCDAILGRIKGTLKLDDLKPCDLIIEVILENKELKKSLYKELSNLCDPKVIFASNTSSMSITELASFTNRPKSVIGFHFFNPVPVMQLVEITRGLETSDEAYQVVKEVGTKAGKTCIEIKDSPGFVVNRILIPMLNEAAFTLMEGVASKEDIDSGMKLGCNQPIGPIALMDLIGLDTVLAIMETFYAEFGDSKYRPCPLIKQMVRAGNLGRKTGKGFYDYSKK